MAQPKGPFRLVTVNTAPERAKRLIGRMADGVKETYTIEHVGNCETIEEVEGTVKELQPDVLFSASMWTAEQAEEIATIGRRTKPGVVTYAIPHGMQVERGPDAVVEFLIENVPRIFDRAAK